MAFRPDEKPLLTTGPFQGLNATNDPHYTDPKFAIEGQNFYPNKSYKGFLLAQGRSLFTPSVAPATPVGNIFKFFTSQTAWTYLMFGADGGIYRFTSGSAFTTVTSGLTPNAPSGRFVEAQNWAFFSDGVDTPIKIDTSFNVTKWGIAAPTAAPTLTPGTGGALTPGGAYAYLFTYSNSVQESSAGPASAFTTLANTPSSGSITYSGTPADGCIIGVTFVAGSKHNQASYQLTSSDTLASAVSQLAVNLALANVFDGITGVASGGTLTLSDPTGQNSSVQYLGYTFNAGSGTLAASPNTGTNFSGGSVQNSITVGSIPTSSDTQVTTVNIYRIGGSQSQFQFVGSVANGTSTYTDTLADNAITGQNLVQFRDPPKPFNDIVFYQDRMWGLGYSSASPYTMSDIWFSNFGQPWAFNAANQVLAANENVGADPIVGGAPLPMMLLVLKRQWAWGVFGTAPSDYVPLPLFPLGCASKYTIAWGYGLVFWLSPDGVVYAFDGVSPQNLSDETKPGASVKAILDAMQPSDYAAATGFVCDRAYFLSFPTVGITLGYSLITQTWFQVGFVTNSVSYDLSNDDEVIGMYTSSGSTYATQWFQGPTDLGYPVAAYYTTAFNDSGSPHVTKTYRHAVIYSASVGGIVTLTFNVRGQQGVTNFMTTVILNGDQTTISLPPTLVGQQIQVRLDVLSSSPALIDQIIVYGYGKRMLSETG